MDRWVLNSLYDGIDDNKYRQDIKKYQSLIDSLNKISEKFIDKNNTSTGELLEEYFQMREEVYLLGSKLFDFVSLSLATDSTNSVLANLLMELNEIGLNITLPETRFKVYLNDVCNLEEIIDASSYLSEYKYILLQIKKGNTHLLSEKEEILISELRQSGEQNLLNMRDYLVPTLEVEFDGKMVSLSDIRTKAFSEDKEIRKNAYLKELESYKKIEVPIAFALNGYKKSVQTLTKKRGYNSPLEKALENNRIDREVLDALLEAMNESLPYFRAYLKRKAQILGHKNGLPFYDLFAPIGKVSKKYTVNEAKEFILENFKSFSCDMADWADIAFTKQWIDFFPRTGKEGGAFCASLYEVKEVRILTNFSGTINDLCVLAHELGHAYHDKLLFKEKYFNSHCPMSIAETASILSESIVKNAVKESYDKKLAINFNQNDKEEKLAILEQELQDDCQVIVDILSRYLFEKEVFSRIEKEFLYPNELNKIMCDAQLKTYGDALDPNFLHPSMWICKSHYYGSNFYNFPYAFGLLFSKGIYAKYLQEKESFVDKINNLLQMSGKADLYDVAMSIGINIKDVNFWKSSIEIIKKNINEFLELTNEINHK